MKTAFRLFILASVLAAGWLTLAAAGRQIPAGPNGGRLLEKTEPNAEFYLEKDHTATVIFYDAALKPVAAGAQAVTIIASPKEGKVTIEFVKQGGRLVSKTKLPEGDGYNLVVQLKQTPAARPQNFRFKLETHLCDECKRPEYACICGH